MLTMPRDERLEARPSERKGDGAPPVVQRHAAGAQLLGAAVAFIPVSGSRSVAKGRGGTGESFYTTSFYRRRAVVCGSLSLSLREKGIEARGREGADGEDRRWQRDEKAVTRRREYR